MTSATPTAARPGDVIPEFAPPNMSDEPAASANGEDSTPIVVLFYRDGECPVCKAALRAYQRRLPTFRAAGARVIAISPETREAALVTAQTSRLDFEFLSDADGTVARRFGIAYEVRSTTQDVAAESRSGDSMQNPALQVPASFIVGAKREIVAASDEARGMLDPDDVVATLRQLAASG